MYLGARRRGARGESRGIAERAGVDGYEHAGSGWPGAGERERWIEMKLTPASAAAEFNEHINAANLRALASLVSEDHRFIDTVGNMVVGKPACIAAWSAFFAAFPGYRNTLEKFYELDNLVTITGFSECPNHPELSGPAIWTATVMAGRLTEWRVYQDTVSNRMNLGIYE